MAGTEAGLRVLEQRASGERAGERIVTTEIQQPVLSRAALGDVTEGQADDSALEAIDLDGEVLVSAQQDSLCIARV